MKKIKSLITLVCVLFVMSACQNNPYNEKSLKLSPSPDSRAKQTKLSELSPKLKASDYFPIKKDVHMKYRGTGNEFAGFETYIDYVYGNIIQVRNITGGTILANVYKVDDAEVTKIFSKEEQYYRYNYTNSSNMSEIIIKGPIMVGNSWTLKDGSKRTITSIDKSVNTILGDYKALEITTKREGSITREYYAENIGLIKREFTPDNSTDVVISELEKRRVDVPLTHIYKVYFPDFKNGKIVFQTRESKLLTNQDMKFVFQKELKTLPKNTELVKTLTANTKILEIKIDEKNDFVEVDFSTDLTKEMNVGSELEGLILKSITNSFGEYFQKSNVVIKINGKPYSGGHFMLGQGEYFRVDLSGVQEYKTG